MRIRPVVAATGAAVLALTLGLTSYAGAARGDRGVVSSPDAAHRALTQARAVLSGAGTTGREATLALRDLALHRQQLTGADRRAADGLLARPTNPGDPDAYGPGTNPKRKCGTKVCVHWVETSGDHVPLTDANGNGTPDYVDKVLKNVQKVHKTYVNAGYRAPRSDKGRGGNDKPDIYLVNVGPDGLYGYCTTDQPNIGPPWNVWAYCVLDNDYDPSEFPTNTPLENMQVTAAHEYFHAVQFAYDAFDDAWFMEGTATWAEDELFDDVDDNVNYLPDGQLADPLVPLDSFSPASLNVYGNWVFFRYLTEKYPTADGGLPTLIRTMWRKADGKKGSLDQYSLQAVNTALKGKGTNVGRQYAAFADANRRPQDTYDEGLDNAYPSPDLWQDVLLTPGAPASGWLTTPLDHLTNATARFTPDATKTDPTWTLEIDVDMAPRARGSRAVVAVKMTGGGTQVSHLALDDQGNGSTSVPFVAGTVAYVEVTLVNASRRFDCWSDFSYPLYSCGGTPKDDNLTEKVQATAVP